MNCLDQTIGENFALYHGDCVEVKEGCQRAACITRSSRPVRQPLHLQQYPLRHGQLPERYFEEFSSTSATS